MNINIAFDNSYARLPDIFYDRQKPQPVSNPVLVKLNTALAGELGLDAKALASQEGVSILAGNDFPPGANPVAIAYAGHQFGHFVPQLGDGRATLIGEIVDIAGKRRDIQLKGSGRTAFSRGGDGRAALGPVIREYILSEAMHALGIATTRSLAMVTTGDKVARETMLPGAVLTRVAASHVRIGTFQYFAARGNDGAIKQLTEYVIDRHYPELKTADNPPLALLKAVMLRQAELVAKWMHVGFVHGVMNTDNMAISGETIDYGPCAFMEQYDPATVFSSIDSHGRYAYANQANIAQWNLARFGETLLGLFDLDKEKAIGLAQETIETFPSLFKAQWVSGMRRKIGLDDVEEEGDLELIQSLLDMLLKHSVDFTLAFRYLSDAANNEIETAKFVELFAQDEILDRWLERWRERLKRQTRLLNDIASAMRDVNPAFIARNHLVEQAIVAAVENQDFSKMDMLLKVLEKPYENNEAYAAFSQPAKPEEAVLQTFCGT